MYKILIFNLILTSYLNVLAKDIQENKPIKFQEIRQLIKIKKIAEVSKKGAEVIIDSYVKVAIQSKISPKMTVAQAREIEKNKAQAVALFNSCLKIEDLVEKLIPLYDSHFTQAEVHYLVQFYQSSIGQKEITSGAPQIMEEDFKSAVQNWIQGASDQFLVQARQRSMNRVPASIDKSKSMNKNQTY